MKWTLIFIFGSYLTENILCWTYHYSNETMTWRKAREWCQKNFTDMVVIQNQTENDYLVSFLPKRNGSPYFWIGITKNHKNETWTWIGNNSTWIGNNSWAENEPNNSYITEFCVEIYTNPSRNYGKWNDEKCDSLKSPACYKTQCNATSCEKGRCQEAINSTSCLCDRGFKGDRCQTVVQCERLSEPANGSMKCSNPLGSFSYQSTCIITCDEGYVLSGSPSLQCEASGKWNASQPLCAAVQCPGLQDLENGFVSCGEDEDKRFSYKNSCSLSCAQGYRMVGPSRVTCTSAATWSQQMPRCEAVECPPLSNPDNGNNSCSGKNQTFNTTCQFKCDPGFLMIGSPAVTCGDIGLWSGPRPTCTSYKQALLAIAGCGAFTTFCCICFCCMKHRQRKKLTQVRQPEEANPTCDAQP